MFSFPRTQEHVHIPRRQRFQNLLAQPDYYVDVVIINKLLDSSSLPVSQFTGKP